MVTMIDIGEEVGPMDSSVWTPGKEVGWVLSPQLGLIFLTIELVINRPVTQ